MGLLKCTLSSVLLINIVGHAFLDDQSTIRHGVVLRKRAPKCDIELFALDLLVLVANRLVQCATYTV